MTREEHLNFCTSCVNRKFDPKLGVICNLTGKIADFEVRCKNFVEDAKVIEGNNKQIESKKIETNKLINKGRLALFIAGGIYLLVVISFERVIFNNDSIQQDIIVARIINWVLALSFFSLAFLSYKRPYFSLLIGLILFLILNILNAFIDPATILRGIYWKIVIIALFVNGLAGAERLKSKIKNIDSDILDN